MSPANCSRYNQSLSDLLHKWNAEEMTLSYAGGTGMIASSSTFRPHPGRVIRDLFRLLDAVTAIRLVLLNSNQHGVIHIRRDDAFVVPYYLITNNYFFLKISK